MKNYILIAMAVFAFASFTTTSLYADEIEHYEGKEFDSKKEAMKALMMTTEKMAIWAAEEDLDVAKMEQIHEISYTTENAVAYLNKKTKLDDLAEKLEAVHISSEDHEADQVRRNFILYQAELATYLSK